SPAALRGCGEVEVVDREVYVVIDSAGGPPLAGGGGDLGGGLVPGRAGVCPGPGQQVRAADQDLADHGDLLAGQDRVLAGAAQRHRPASVPPCFAQPPVPWASEDCSPARDGSPAAAEAW